MIDLDVAFAGDDAILPADQYRALKAVAEAAQALAVTEHGSYSKDPEYWTAVRLPEFRALTVQLSDLIHGGS